MPNKSLKANFNGQTIQLDEPYELPRDAQLLVTVLSPLSSDSSMHGWAERSAAGLARLRQNSEPDTRRRTFCHEGRRCSARGASTSDGALKDRPVLFLKRMHLFKTY